MTPLTLEDLLPLEEYAPRRREFFDSHRRYVDRYRRVRIGPRLTLIFENRQTLWFRVQEIVRVARLSDRSQVAQELELYNRLLPAGNLLQAALLLDLGEDAAPDWQRLDGSHLRLAIGDDELASRLVTSRSADRCVGTAHWVQFVFAPSDRSRFADFLLPARFRFDDGRYTFSTNPLADDLRQSLLGDLDVAEAA
jgi:hypothetical protein